MTDVELRDIEIPGEYLDLCTAWHSGLNCKLYAVASTGALTLGSRRPWGDFVDRYLTDTEWHVSLWNDLESDVRYAADMAERNSHEDEQALREFEAFCERTADELRTAYGLEESEAV
jgi:hypothetical protein